MTEGVGRHERSEAFLRHLDADWARLIDLVGPCLHDPKAAREPYEALVRAIAYQQLTAKAGDAITQAPRFRLRQTSLRRISTRCADVVFRQTRSQRSRRSPKARSPA
jgi:hypothetical protein